MYGGCTLGPSKPHETIASPPLKRSLDSTEIELTSAPSDAAPHEGPPSNASQTMHDALESEKSAKMAKIASNKELHFEDPTSPRAHSSLNPSLGGPSLSSNEVPQAHAPPLPSTEAPSLGTTKSTPTDDPLSIGCTLFSVSRPKPVDEPSSDAPPLDLLNEASHTHNYIGLLDCF